MSRGYEYLLKLREVDEGSIISIDKKLFFFENRPKWEKNIGHIFDFDDTKKVFLIKNVY